MPTTHARAACCLATCVMWRGTPTLCLSASTAYIASSRATGARWARAEARWPHRCRCCVVATPRASPALPPAKSPRHPPRHPPSHPLTHAQVRFVVMNNVFRTDLPLHRKYDLKGSTWQRTAGPRPSASGGWVGGVVGGFGGRWCGRAGGRAGQQQQQWWHKPASLAARPPPTPHPISQRCARIWIWMWHSAWTPRGGSGEETLRGAAPRLLHQHLLPPSPPHTPTRPPRHTPPHRLARQLAADCTLLEALNVMDYSLLLGVHIKSYGEASATSAHNTDKVGGWARRGGACVC